MKTLKANAIGLMGATLFGIVMMSPAMGINGNFGPAFLAAGKSTPLAFLLALLATIPTAISYALLSREYPDAGSASSWIHRATPGRLASWAGWIVFLYYFTNFIMQPVTLGVFLQDALTGLGFKPGMETYLIGATLCCVWPAWLVYRGISPSEQGVLGFLTFESLVVISLCLSVFFFASSHGGGNPSFSTFFQVDSTTFASGGVFRAVIFGMLAFCGFDVISTLSEESRLARKLIPQATFISLVLFGGFIVIAMWALTFAASPEQLKHVADSGGMPISEVARIYWGKAAILIPLTAISASLGLSVATAVGASRILLSIGRRESRFEWLADLHPEYQVPWNAMHLIFVIGFIATAATGIALGAYGAYVWWGTTSVFFAMVTYFLVNTANLILFRHRIREGIGPMMLHLVIPVLGITLDGYILVRSFFIELWNQGWATGQSVIFFDLACALIAAGVAVFWLPAKTEEKDILRV